MMKPGLRTMWMAFFLCAVMLMNIAAADIGNGPGVADRKEFEALFAAEEYDKAAEFYRERDLRQIQLLDDYKAFLDIQSALADESADYALVISKLKVLQQRGFAPTGWQSSVAAWVSYATGRQAESVGDYDAAVTAYEQAGGTADSVSRLEVCLQLKRQRTGCCRRASRSRTRRRFSKRKNCMPRWAKRTRWRCAIRRWKTLPKPSSMQKRCSAIRMRLQRTTAR